MKKVILPIASFFLAFNLFAQIPAGYYDTADGLSGDQLKAALNTIIKGHTEYPYSSSSTDVWDILKETDRDPNNANNVVGLYSGFSMNAAAEYDGGNGWNREHVWAKSRGDFGTTLGAGTDIHHLRAADISTNSARSNRTFSEAANEPYTDASGQYNGPTSSFTSSSEFIWKPRAEVRGDVARMIFYMATRYEGEAGEPDLELTDMVLSNTDKSPLHGRLTDLLAWHQQDPVDDMERSRNDIIYSYQNNRNPFIDHPEYVALIWGGTSSNAPFFTSTATTSGTVGTTYSYTITTGGGAGAVSISAIAIPSWLTLADNGDGTGTLSGTPTATGTFNVQLQVSDGTDSDTQIFDITVSSNGGGSGGASDLVFSEYIEGSSYNKALEVANFTGASVNLSSYQIKKQSNGAGSWSAGLTLSGSLADGDVYVVAHSSASASITAQADFTGGNSELTFNGNDALGLFKDGVLIDAIGVFNSSATFGQNVTLVRNADVTAPNATYTTSEWTSYGSDTFDYIGSHTMNAGTPNESPVVSLTSPVDGSTYTDGDNVTITADASDSDGSIAAVEFFVDGSSVGVDTTSPYQGTFTIGVGSFTITAVATDNESATTTSSAVGVTGEEATSGTASELLISEYIEGSSFNKAIEVANFTGTSVNLSSYEIRKQTNGAGSWSSGLTLSGSLADGDVYVIANSSASATILALADFSGGNSELTFNGNDAIGLFKDGVLIDAVGVFNSTATFGQNVTLVRNADVTAPNASYTTSEWTSYASDTFDYIGSHTMNGGGGPANQAPVVAITSPAVGSSFSTGDPVSVTADASDTDGTITSVEFFVNGSSIGTDTNSPFSASFSIAEGASSITVVATDNDGASTTSTAINVSATTPNQAPTVAISSPSNGATFTDGDAVSISASASDADGNIASVEFFVNGSSIGVDTSAPYESSFTIGVGAFTISATATDNDGATTNSTTVGITGEEATAPGSTLISFDDFESGWGTFRDGGSDCYRYTGGTYAFGGSAAGGIQDNSGASSSFYTNNGFDATGFDQLEVEFYFYPRSMENGEDFWLRFYDGSAWNTVETWARGTDFSNNNFYVTTVTIDASQYNFSSDAKLRFQCDASGNGDDVYIDEVTVTGIVNGSGARQTNRETITEFVKAGIDEGSGVEANFAMFPNPTTDFVNIQVISEEREPIVISVVDLQGKVLSTQRFESVVGINELSVNLTELEVGMYLIKVTQGEETTTQLAKRQ